MNDKFRIYFWKHELLHRDWKLSVDVFGGPPLAACWVRLFQDTEASVSLTMKPHHDLEAVVHAVADGFISAQNIIPPPSSQLYTVNVKNAVSRWQMCVFVGVLRKWRGIPACLPAVSWRIRPNKPSAERWSKRRWGEPSSWSCRETPQGWDRFLDQTVQHQRVLIIKCINNLGWRWYRNRRRRRTADPNRPATISKGWRTLLNRPQWRPGWDGTCIRLFGYI